MRPCFCPHDSDIPFSEIDKNISNYICEKYCIRCFENHSVEDIVC